MTSIVLFDGECSFCDRSVQFIIKRDPSGMFKFASLQSEAGQVLLKQFNVPNDIDSIILLEEEKWYGRSSAALRISRKLSGCWKLAFVLILIPKPFRDFFYTLVAKNRYKWFGKKTECLLPNPNIRDRFLK